MPYEMMRRMAPSFALLVLLGRKAGAFLAFSLADKPLFKQRQPSLLEPSLLAHNEDHTDTVLVFPGGGVYFYWQAGVVTYLREHGYSMDHLAGSSAGALTASLAATGVDYQQATELAIQLALDAGVWDRAEGLQGVWGELVETWLRDLLPTDACQLIHQKAAFSLLVTKIPSLRKERVSTFTDREDLIQCNMASIHLPWFLNSQPWAKFRGKLCIDGSFLASPFDYGTATEDGTASSLIMIDHKDDPIYRDNDLLSFVDTVRPDTLYEMMEDGKRHARRMEEKGEFERLLQFR